MPPSIFYNTQNNPDKEQKSLQSTPIFSIIIPTYNVESYIARCLEFCINQTLREIEILVIDDCGSDSSIHIAQDYADKDSKIRIIKNPKNLGTFGARLTGIKSALGLYTIFLDADDYLAPNACEIIYRQALKSKINTQNTIQSLENLPDIIHFHPTYQSAKNASPIANILHKMRYILPTRFSKKPLQNHQIAQNFFLKSYHFPKFTLWDKCYKTTLIKQILPFMEDFIPLKLTMAEDMLKFFVIVALAQSYVSINKRLYIYCLNSSSITQNLRAKDKKIADLAHIVKALPDLADKLRAYNPLMPQIAQRLCNNLIALMLLESRFEPTLSSLQTTINQFLISLDSSYWVNSKLFSTLKDRPYLHACVLSLNYWNRCLTWIRIIVYLGSFGKVKI
ncbi:glycosyltransferase family 2 protein [uncultured Helicobacter sp.]|uniref:glycosyltransferase family 2 protein n=1 Tax=uncultured Helicobacter sp. TaxID=175537 RepID=UPI002639D211|nr:glycosyltransferase family 2 protein [uncultured Helicobacter sp.]